MLTDDQKRTRLDISRYHLSRYEDNPGDFIDNMRHGFTTLTQSKTIAKQTTEAPWPIPPKKFKRVYSEEKLVASIRGDHN